jgi:SMI1-KNR4 cell-wall
MESIKSIKDIADYLITRDEDLNRLSLSEIQAIEEKSSFLLPSTYKEFLSLMGNGAGSYMIGSSVYHAEIPFLKQWAADLTVENQLSPLPVDAFVFWMHQGYQAAYFRLSEGQDPPIYYFSEGNQDKEFRLIENSLTNFFIVQLKISYPDVEIV